MIDKINETKLEHRRIVVREFQGKIGDRRNLVSTQSSKGKGCGETGIFRWKHEFERGSLYFSGSLNSNTTIYNTRRGVSLLESTRDPSNEFSLLSRGCLRGLIALRSSLDDGMSTPLCTVTRT